jgi:hypothetical protein
MKSLGEREISMVHKMGKNTEKCNQKKRNNPNFNEWATGFR